MASGLDNAQGRGEGSVTHPLEQEHPERDTGTKSLRFAIINSMKQKKKNLAKK